MSDLLEEIAAKRRKTLENEKIKMPLKNLIRKCERAGIPRPFRKAIDRPGTLSIIAEMKRQSPSAGPIFNGKYEPKKIAGLYESGGASALSVLTEEDYFKGQSEHIREARKGSSLPILRKDFTIDAYQIYETKISGASAVLLIVALLSKKELSFYMQVSRENGLDALVEVHTKKELDTALSAGADLIGINNRNLKNLETHIETTFRLIEQIPKGVCVISESGIKDPETIRNLKNRGVRAALIGESILRSPSPAEKLRSFVEAGQS